VTSIPQRCIVLLAAGSLASCAWHVPALFLPAPEPAQSALTASNLTRLDIRRGADEAPPVPAAETAATFEDDDGTGRMEMGVAAVDADSHKAGLRAKILEHVTLRPDLAVDAAGDIAGAMRVESPRLMMAVNGFMRETRKDAGPGGIPVEQSFVQTNGVQNAVAHGEDGKVVEAFGLIRRHAAAYDFDPLLIAAQGYQESGLDQSKRSPVGAIGIMQVMPATARDPNVGIPDIHIAERNVEAGVKYLRFVKDRYFSDAAISPVDRLLFSFAAYNAGPGNVAKARKRAEEMGLDPNVWLDSVELAAEGVISREPVAYVRNILKRYVMTYRLFEERLAARDE
jgi:membrane-bound lytic murein transglycosylase MltF